MRTFRAVVVGLGAISTEWLRVLGGRGDVEVVALVDFDATRAAAQRSAFGLLCPVGSDLESAIGEQRADLVVVLTPPALHREVAEPALAAGCDVIVEKPLAAEIRDAVALVEVAQAAGRTLAVMQNRRYHPAIRALREHVARGSIGVPVDIAVDMFLWHRFPNTFLAEIDSPLLRDMAIHQFDAARAISGADARTVQALEWNSPASWMAGAAAATATFELSNGTVFSYRGSWVAEGAATSYDGVWRICGTRGALTWDGTGDVVLETVKRPAGPYEPGTETRTRHASNFEPGTTSHALALAAILESLRAGEAPETVARDNLLSLAMVDSALRSSRARQTVEVADVLVDAGWAA
ncbi:MAG: Gfo/Idh/MocA family oxidoreductase [Thermoleophilia bacterium]|nr:Gfo/Idh/MocA family oxidoreductase [Thermoleophilia bacterium]